MIVVDASIVGPIVLLDEAPLPPAIASALAAAPLIAPAHWPLEIANLLLVAERRGRTDAAERAASYATLAALRVDVAVAADLAMSQAIVALAGQHRLTAYDAAYLHLALVRTASIATLDAALARAATRRGVHVLTFS